MIWNNKKRGDILITEKIKKIFFSIKNDVNNKMKPYDLTASQIILLKYLYENIDNTVIQKDICEYLSLKHSTIINILKRLELKGLIKKNTNYKSEISITKKGIELVESVGAKKGFVENKLLNGFTKEEIDDLSNYLDRLYSNINN